MSVACNCHHIIAFAVHFFWIQQLAKQMTLTLMMSNRVDNVEEGLKSKAAELLASWHYAFSDYIMAINLNVDGFWQGPPINPQN